MRHLTLGLAAGIALTVSGVAVAAPLPNLAASANGTLQTFRPDGTPVATLPATSWWSIGDTRVAIDAGTGANDKVAVRDARTGLARYTISNAFRPIVLPAGEVAFWPGRNGVRDPLLDSLWIRRADGSIRKLLQLPGGEDTLLSSGFDGTGRRAVLANLVRKILVAHLARSAERRRALHAVLQLAHVARPRIGDELRHRRRRQDERC